MATPFRSGSGSSVAVHLQWVCPPHRHHDQHTILQLSQHPLAFIATTHHYNTALHSTVYVRSHCADPRSRQQQATQSSWRSTQNMTESCGMIVIARRSVRSLMVEVT